MGFFNYYGLAIFVLIMIPNIIFGFTNKQQFENKFDNKLLTTLEQIGRYGCMIFLIFNIPFLYFGFWLDNALAIYLICNGIILAIYLLTWTIMCKKNNLTRALILSITPSVLFLFCGIFVLSIPLILFSLIFAPTHISISILNSKEN